MSGRHRARHRRPGLLARRSAGVLAGSTAALVAVPSVADAGPPAGWDAVIDCESSGDPQAFNGIAHYGAFQFDIPTWRSVGGTGNPRDASLAEQTARADVLYKRRGLQPWLASRSCWAGKVGQTGLAPVNTGQRPTSPARAEPPGRGVSRAAGASTYTVKSGDTLSGIAVPRGLNWRAVHRDNVAVIGVDENVLMPGQQLTLNRATQSLASGPAGAVEAPTASGASVAALAFDRLAVSTSRGSRIVAAAKEFQGVRYRYGGSTRSGIDCSALVQNALREVGVQAPRTSRAQEAWATSISRSEARPGDLVFYYRPTSHVGIYLGDGKMIDAPRPGMTVGVRDVYPGARFARVPG